MNDLTPVVVFAVGLSAGAGSVWFFMKNQTASALDTAKNIAKQQIENNALTMKSFIESAKSEMRDETLRLGANERKSFMDLAATQVSEALNPVRNDLTKIREYVATVEKERVSTSSEIMTTIKLIQEQHKDLSVSTQTMATKANALVSALSNSSVRGRWGEIQLKTVVERAGMLSWCDFNEQTSSETDDGGRPDMTIKIPGNKVIFVDSKAPLAAYLKEMDEEDEVRRREYRREHARAVRFHVDALVKRAYHKSDSSTGFTIMFIPGEAFIQAALTEQPDLLEYAQERNIYLCGPILLVPLLRSYALGWREQQQDERAREIAKLGSDMHERIRIFLKHQNATGAALATAVARYNDAVGSLTSRVIPQAKRIHEAAALHTEELPEIPSIDSTPRQLSLVSEAE